MDWGRILTLLSVVRECVGHPRLSVISSVAMAELEAIANPPKQAASEPPAERTEADRLAESRARYLGEERRM